MSSPYAALATALVCAYAAVCALESLVAPAVYQSGGLMSWDNQRIATRQLSDGRTARLAAALYEYPNVRALYLLQLALASGQLALVRAGPTALLCALAVVTWLIAQRTAVGQDGADQMALVVMVALALTVLVPTDHVRAAALAFIALQGIAAYTIAGVAKLRERGWHDGTHLAAILATESYGVRPVGRWLGRHPRLGAAASLGVLGWESTFAVAMLGPRPVAYAYLAVGAAFHVANAALMGLDTFLLAFGATYPAIVWLLLIRPW